MNRNGWILSAGLVTLLDGHDLDYGVPMSPFFPCPHCGNQTFADDSLLGTIVTCPHCSNPIQLPGRSFDVLPPPLPQPQGHMTHVQASNEDECVTISPAGEISVQFRSAAEGKRVIKKLRLLKKQFAAEKKKATAAQRMLRAQYTEQVRLRGSKMRGGGFIGSVVRGFQTASRDAERANLAQALAPWETEKNRCDNAIHAIENLILQVEAQLT